MYEPSRVLLSFHIAGFQYADGALVLGDLKAGDKLTLCAERDNPHDRGSCDLLWQDQTWLRSGKRGRPTVLDDVLRPRGRI